MEKVESPVSGSTAVRVRPTYSKFAVFWVPAATIEVASNTTSATTAAPVEVATTPDTATGSGSGGYSSCEGSSCAGGSPAGMNTPVGITAPAGGASTSSALMSASVWCWFAAKRLVASTTSGASIPLSAATFERTLEVVASRR